ncbi:Protein of unknown function DUF262 [Sulfitobacter litoralis]|uniref:GmrSD restriction endonucleases N-terminal domain-containing protein n=1 Tax=Sulfitobacter litoralis TaxID=335975 RepID=A0ABY0SX10_9RHOB|nr:DUF262 domain-containing protein [Sulfitobacter litoralis]SDP71357.1 Protein of unknown function DUF262 [Sulfitobacter litoralis]
MVNKTDSTEADGFEDEDFDSNEENFARDEPFDPKKVDVSITTPNLSALITRLKHEEIDLMPDFQRSGDLWSKQAQSRLIESILIRLPIPAFYFDAIDDDRWQVVDGLQRLSAINNFVLKKTLKLTNLEFLTEYEGCSYDELPRPLTRRIDEFQTSVYLIKPGTPLEMKYSLFNRINTGGLKLTPQEIRHAMSQSANSGAVSKFLSRIVENEIFIKVVGRKNNRMVQQELVLRHMAFVIFTLEEYRSSLPKFLDTAMITLSEFSESQLIELESRFLISMELADEIFGEDAFRKSLVDGKKLVNKPLFEALSVSLAKLEYDEQEQLLLNKDQFLDEFRDLLLDDEFNETISRSTSSSTHVYERFTRIEQFIREFITELLI